MPLLYTHDVTGHWQLWLRLGNDGATIAFTTRREEATTINIESPYSAVPLSLGQAAANPPVVFRFPGRVDTPMYPAANAIAEGSLLSVAEKPTSSADALYRRGTVIETSPGTGAYTICQSIAPAYGIGRSTAAEDAHPILTKTRAHALFYEDTGPTEPGFCESCDAEVPPGCNWCGPGCRADVRGW
jgi:hypothetical protein